MTLTVAIVRRGYGLLAADRRAVGVDAEGSVVEANDSVPKLHRIPAGWTAGTGVAEVAEAGSDVLSELPPDTTRGDVARRLEAVAERVGEIRSLKSTRTCWPTMWWTGDRIAFTVYRWDGTVPPRGGVGARWITWPKIPQEVADRSDRELAQDLESIEGPVELVRRVARLFVEARTYAPDTIGPDMDIGLIVLEPGGVRLFQLGGPARDLAHYHPRVPVAGRA